MPEPLTPQRIAVLGVGRIGSAFAFQLALVGGHDVTVIARPGSQRLAQLERDRAIIDAKGRRAAVRVRDHLDETTPYDLIIVTLLAHQVEPLLSTLQRSAAGCVQFMFNTFTPERLQSAVEPERCAFGMPFIQANLNAEGRLKLTIGGTGQKTIMDRPRWVDVFATAGLPAALEPNMPLWLRCHAPLCVAFESVSVAGERRGGGAAWSEAMTLAIGVKACFALITAIGEPIYPHAKRSLAANPTWMLASMLWFMSHVASFRKLLATGEQEARALATVIAAAAPPALAPKILAMKPE